MIPAEIILSDIQPASFPEVDEGIVSGSTEAFSDMPIAVSVTNAVEMPHDVRGFPSFSKALVFSAQKPCAFPCPEIEYGSKAPAMYSDMAMYSNTTFGSKMPAMYVDTVFGSKAPLMYSDTVIGSNGERSF